MATWTVACTPDFVGSRRLDRPESSTQPGIVIGGLLAGVALRMQRARTRNDIMTWNGALIRIPHA